MKLTRTEFDQLKALIGLPMTCDVGLLDEQATCGLRDKRLATRFDGLHAATAKGVRAYYFSPAGWKWHLRDWLRHNIKFPLQRAGVLNAR